MEFIQEMADSKNGSERTIHTMNLEQLLSARTDRLERGKEDGVGS